MSPITGHFSVQVPGGWITGYVPTQTVLDYLDQAMSQSLNGDGGGTWSPSAPIIIGGSGLQCPASATWNFSGTVSGNATLAGNSHSSMQWGGLLNVTGTLQTNAFVFFASGTQANVQSGATLEVTSGASFLLDSGSTVAVDTTIGILSAGGINASAVAAAAVKVPGQGIQITDGTNPQFATARTRRVVQPWVVYGAFSAFAGQTLTDNGLGGTFYVQLTKLINKATLNAITLVFDTAGASVTSPTNSAVVELHRAQVVPGFPTIGDTTLGTVNVLAVINAQQQVSLTFTPFAVDDSQYTYYLKFTATSGTGAQSYRWYCSVLDIVNITELGQGQQ